MNEFKDFKKKEKLDSLLNIALFPITIIKSLFGCIGNLVIKIDDKIDDIEYETDMPKNLIYIFFGIISFFIIIPFISIGGMYYDQKKFYEYVTENSSHKIDGVSNTHEYYQVKTIDNRDRSKKYRIEMYYYEKRINVHGVSENKNLDPNGYFFYEDLEEYFKESMDSNMIEFLDGVEYKINNKNEY